MMYSALRIGEVLCSTVWVIEAGEGMLCGFAASCGLAAGATAGVGGV